MHQIYSCSDENFEVFTTVISSKSCSPARRRAKCAPHILTTSVVAIPNHRSHQPEKLQPHQRDLFQVLYSEDKVRDWGPHPKGSPQHVGITGRESSKSCNHLLDGKSVFSPLPGSHVTARAAAATDSFAGNSTSTEDPRQHWRRMAEYDLTLPPSAEASLPLTGGSLCGTPSLLRKMWMKHKKKSEYLGATNSAFEAD